MPTPVKRWLSGFIVTPDLTNNIALISRVLGRPSRGVWISQSPTYFRPISLLPNRCSRIFSQFPCPCSHFGSKSPFSMNIDMYLWYVISICFMFVNNSINFWFYVFGGETFRNEFLTMIGYNRNNPVTKSNVSENDTVTSAVTNNL